MSVKDNLVREVQQEQLPKHDAILCKPTDASRIINVASKGVNVPSGSNFNFRGLEIVPLEGWVDTPTLCQKSEVFPVARNWKDY